MKMDKEWDGDEDTGMERKQEKSREKKLESFQLSMKFIKSLV